jgi:hypothetical protein
MATKADTQDPTAVQRIVAKPMDALKRHEMGRDATTIFMGIYIASNEAAVEMVKKTRADKEMASFLHLYDILTKRLAFYPFELEEKAKLFLSVSGIVQTPGIMVMYLAYLQYKGHQENIQLITLEKMSQYWFADGFFHDNDLEAIWIAQKITDNVGVNSDNLLDYGTAYGSMTYDMAKQSV